MLNPRKPCVVANWKMHGSKERVAKWIVELSKGLKSGTAKDLDVVLCPPSVYLQESINCIRNQLSSDALSIGCQNVYCLSEGAFTGEISPEMLIDVGCRYVILGHSERRQLFLEEDTLIASKFVAAYHAGLIPIICVGETRQEREQGKTKQVVSRQLQAVLELAPKGAFGKSLIAYEPVWAIGTGLTASPDQAQEVHAFLRGCLAERDWGSAETVRILYGGSVKADNAKTLFAQSDIDGALVGGASLNAEEFLNICKSF